MTRKSRYTLALLAGDGIGPEVTAQASRALAAASRLHGFSVDERHVPLGADAHMRYGHSFPPPSRAAALSADAILVASARSTFVSTLEQELDLRAGVARVRFGDDEELSVVAPIRRDAWEWTLERAFALARASRARVCLVEAHGAWAEEAEAAAGRHDGVDVERLTMGAAVHRLLHAPDELDVVVCGPELAAAVIETAACLHETRTVAWGRLAASGPSVFGPTHGRAVDIAGQGVADPSSMLLAAALLLGEGLGERGAAATLTGALASASGTGRRVHALATGSQEFTDAVLDLLPSAVENAEFYSRPLT